MKSDIQRQELLLDTLARHPHILTRKIRMGVQKKTRKFATVKRIISQRDSRLKKNIDRQEEEQQKKKAKGDDLIREVFV